MEPWGAQNAWIVSVRGARRRLGAIRSLIIAFLTLSIALIAGPRLYEAWQSLPDAQSASPALSQSVYYLIVFVPFYACAILSRSWEKRAATGARFSRWRGLVLGTLVGAVLFNVVVLAASISGLLQERPAVPGAGLALRLGLAALITAFQAYGEELFFRGWLQPILATEWGSAVALVTTSVLFAGAHCVMQIPSGIAIANTFLAGLLFGLMALRTGGLAAPAAAHFVWNWVEQSVLGLTPNPGVDPLGSLVDLDLVGPVLLSGGIDGLNGSLFVTATLMMAAVAFGLAPVSSALPENPVAASVRARPSN